ncbi:hypothetical protein NMY22_g12254 [Coprinellus aureogranulatus]|nr:hypothetical protein NMY22_g12254 [Coprinellus aureogranulatus]
MESVKALPTGAGGLDDTRSCSPLQTRASQESGALKETSVETITQGSRHLEYIAEDIEQFDRTHMGCYPFQYPRYRYAMG